MKTLIIILTLVMLIDVQAGDRKQKRESHNYIIERQQAGQVQGVPISRSIRGKREIDIYPNGLMFEKNSVVGVSR